MLASWKKLLGLSVVAAIVVWAIAGCGGGSGSSSGFGEIELSLVDAPFDADEINVAITSVQVHSEENGWVTLVTHDPALPVNLLDYSTGGTSLMLADMPLAAGHYTMIRLMLESANLVIDGTTYQVDLTNVEQTGVKCNGEFTVGEGELVALMLDFNAGKSFVNNPPGSNNFKLHPVMAMSPVNIASEVIGVVEVQDSEATVVPIPADSVVDVYAEGYLLDPDYLITGAFIEEDGSFRISVLAAGTYDMIVVLGDGTTLELPGVAITPPSTDLGTIVVVQP